MLVVASSSDLLTPFSFALTISVRHSLLNCTFVSLLFCSLLCSFYFCLNVIKFPLNTFEMGTRIVHTCFKAKLTRRSDIHKVLSYV